jgi:hypothetical protein
MTELTDILEKVANLMDYVTHCIDLPMYAASCRPLWSVIMYASVLVGSAVIGWVFWLAVTRQNSVTATPARSTGANQRKRRKTPDERVDVSDVTDPHLAMKIRQELERQRIRNITGR